MNIFYPFIYPIKKKVESEPIPLYLEIIPPLLPEKKEEKDEESGVVIIELL